jgi:hypothetical protein
MVWHGKGKGDKMIFVEKETGGPGMPAQMEMRHMKQMAADQEGISYHITVDGVTVNIRAPKEKVKEADLILEE